MQSGYLYPEANCCYFFGYGFIYPEAKCSFFSTVEWIQQSHTWEF